MPSERYVIEREVGRGGSAIVYRARDIELNRLVALKVMRPELAAAVGVTRFLREIEIERRLKHPNILPILDAGTRDGLPYCTMPFVEGETLRDRVRREKQLPLDDVVEIARQVALALDHAHAEGVVHRDVKPANILLPREGGAILADFGIARAMTIAAGDRITDSGIAVGTPEYMSPEQATLTSALDARSDIYALGCVAYEMLAGEPPFTGPTTQAIVARHCQEAPRELRIIRPSLGDAVQRALGAALAKVPADRVARATTFVERLAVAIHEDARAARRGRRRTRAWVATVGLLAAGAVGWLLLRPVLALDANRIVVFPLRDSPGAVVAGASGEEVATYVGYALEGTRPLKWIEGWELLDARERADVGTLGGSRARALARAAHAAHFIDGAIVRSAESTTVVLRLHDVTGDSVVLRTGAAGTAASSSAPALGLRAVAGLFPALLAPGRSVDLTALEDRAASAVANFLQGEREYRRMHFDAAIQHYHEALREDSALALAALRGAEAANWRGRYGEDTLFVHSALLRVGFLPPRQALAAQGLHAYLTGAADSAAVYLKRAVAADSSSAPLWTLLGEVYARMLPEDTPADSLARDALEHARRADRDFSPALLLLEEMALRDGRVRDALTLREDLRAAGADTSHEIQRDLMLRCVRDGERAVDWGEALRRDTRAVLAAGKVLSAGAAQAECARAAFTAVLSADSSRPNQRWGALMGLQSLLIAMGRAQEVPPLMASRGAAGLPSWALYILDATSGAGLEPQAAAAVAQKGGSYAAMPVSTLYLLALWASHRGDAVALREIARNARLRADSTRARGDALLARAIDARQALAGADTSEAIRRLRALAPTAPRNEITWQMGEPLGAERLLLAQLLFARGRLDDAMRVASRLDAPEPFVYLLYLRPSLTLRANAARLLGANRTGTLMERRLSRLTHSTGAVPPQ